MTAWQARRTYPWCRDTPLDIFERFTVAPRALEEPLERVQAGLYNRLKQEVKYCRTTGEASDVVGAWRRRRVAWKESGPGEDATPGEVMASQAGNCQHLILLYTYLARSAGLPVRPVRASWSTFGAEHYWVEVWDVEEHGWHSFDASAVDRTYYSNWVTNVPKAATHAATAERGAWNAARENRWEAYTNTVGLFYPSGTVLVRVLEGEVAKPGGRVNVEIWKNGAMVLRTSAPTDSRGEVRFTLGQSPRKPYRFVLDKPAMADWEWLAVQAGKQYELTLHTDRTRPFDPAAEPPPLGFPEWKGPAGGRRQ